MGDTQGPYYTSNMNLADTADLVSDFDEIARRAICSGFGAFRVLESYL